MTMLISHFWLKEPMPVEKMVAAILIVGGNIISLAGKMKVKK